MIRFTLLKSVTIGTLSAVAIVSLASPTDARHTDGLSCLNTYSPVGIPEAVHVSPEAPHLHILCRQEFILAYNETTKVADWVMERLDNDQLSGDADRDHSHFSTDPEFADIPHATLDDYRGSGYDRGHQAPAGNFKSNQGTMDESFYLSNIAPQVGVGFNRNIWRHVEEQVRTWTIERDQLFVITGPVYYDYVPTIGEGKVVVPDAFYKIVFDAETGQSMSFLLPNRHTSDDSYQNYLVPIRYIETLTGYNFFPNLNSVDQDIIETTTEQFWQ